jgi:hypothetical protein
MLSAIDFDDQTRLEADEIDNITIYRLLPPESPSLNPSIPQQPPQGAFGIRHAPAQLACILD